MDKRLGAVDTVRTIGIIGVLIGHNPNWVVFPEMVTFGIGQFIRFAVPFFFIVAGYFWAGKFQDERDLAAPTWKSIKRISTVFLQWSLIFLLPLNIAGALEGGLLGPLRVLADNIQEAASHPLRLLHSGTSLHLWFLSSLVIALAVCGLMLRMNQKRLLILLAIGLYVLGLSAHAYGVTPLGIKSSPVDFSNGPHVAIAFVLTGYFLQRTANRAHWFRWGALLAAAGFALQCTEVLTIHEKYDGYLFFDFTVGTYPFGLGVAMMALSGNRLLDIGPLARIGPYVLGIYVSHELFMRLLTPFYDPQGTSLLYYLAYLSVVFGLSYWFSALIPDGQVMKRLTGWRRSGTPALVARPAQVAQDLSATARMRALSAVSGSGRK